MMKDFHSRKFYREIKPILAKEYLKGLTIKTISEYHNLSEKFVWDSLVELNIPRREGRKECRRYSLDETFFETINTEEKAYILGFIYADGYVSKNDKKQRYMLRITLQRSDEEILHKMNKCLSSIKPLYYGVNITKKGYRSSWASLSLFSKKIIYSLEKLECLSPKAKRIQFPSFLEESFIRHFVRGYTDGDGHIGIDNNSQPVLHISGNPLFIKQLKDYLVQELNIGYYINKQSDNTHVLEFHSCQSVSKVAKWLWEDSNIFLDRKFEQYKKIKKRC